MLSFFRKFYFSVKSSSIDQLRADFGEFPPLGVSIGCVRFWSFDIVYASRFGFFVFWLMSFPALVRLAWNTGRLNQLEELKESFSSVIIAFYDSGVAGKAIFICFFVLLLPAFIFLLPLFFALFAFYNILKVGYGLSEPGVGGYYLPSLDGSNRFLVRMDVYREGGDYLNACIAHEHIHMLQHLNFISTSKSVTPDIEDARLNLILKEKYSKSPSFLYVGKRKEMEARLHEIVLSFYRENHCLPHSLGSFVAMIVLNSDDRGLLMSMFDEGAKGEFMEFGYNSYSTRGSVFGEQFYLFFVAIDSEEKVLRYLLEVLPVMYANLLEYYGDLQASLRFRQLIQGPCLYEQLYSRAIH